LQQRQQGITRLHATTELGNGCGTMPDPVPLDQDRPPCQGQTTLPQLRSEGMIAATIAQLKIVQTCGKLGALSKIKTERTAPVVNQFQRHRVT
jgi:hypothetical protein